LWATNRRLGEKAVELGKPSEVRTLDQRAKNDEIAAENARLGEIVRQAESKVAADAAAFPF
jgi:hypothetical protein